MRYVLAISVLLTGFVNAETPSSIEWTWGPVLPNAQTALGTAAIGDQIVVVGGTYWIGPVDGIPKKIWSNKVHLLDTNTEKWRSLPDYPLPVGYPLSVPDADTLWVIGGTDGDKVYSEVYLLDLTQKDPTWKPGPPLPTPRFAAQGGLVDGVIYVAAGIEKHADTSQAAASVVALDTRATRHQWRHVTDIPGPAIEWRMGTLSHGILYLFGGLVAPDPAPEFPDQIIRARHNVPPLIPRGESFAFDLASRRWRELEPLPAPVGSGACTALDENHLVLTAGLAMAIPKQRAPDKKDRTYLTSECLLYDVARDRYTPIDSLPIGLVDQGAALINGRIYVLGGEDSSWKTRTDFVHIGRVR